MAICLPTTDVVRTNFAFSLYSMLLSSSHKFSILNLRSSILPASRYTLVRAALDCGADRVLFIDSDMIFPPNAMDRLVEHDLDIVGATYVSRHNEQILGVGVDDVEPGAVGLRRMSIIPFGMMMIRADVFRKVPEPWFLLKWDAVARTVSSDDDAFCMSARESGYDIWCDLDLSHELGHEGSHVFTWGVA